MERQKKLARLNIAIHSRLHLTLLAMHAGEYRINGGVGFAIDAPACEITFSCVRDFIVDDQRADPLSVNELERLTAVLKAEQQRCGFASAIRISIGGEMRTHFGFGSGTAIRLACLEALHRLNGFSPTPAELVTSSGRGGTSGVGIHTYFSGGCVFDLGRPAVNELHVSSHQVVIPHQPLVLSHLPMPEWDIGICIPFGITHKTEAEEQEFFNRVCPLSAQAVYETVYHTIFGLYAAIRDADRSTFCRALRSIQECSWKKAERLEYGTELMEIEQALYSCGAEAVGMSSLGPSLFFLADDVAAVTRKMQRACTDCDCFITSPANHGRVLQND